MILQVRGKRVRVHHWNFESLIFWVYAWDDVVAWPVTQEEVDRDNPHLRKNGFARIYSDRNFWWSRMAIPKFIREAIGSDGQVTRR